MPLPIHFAPLQGYTEDAYRRVHHALLPGIAAYYSPFLRLEHGAVRSKDQRDILREHNEGLPLVPQIIASSADELEALLPVVRAQGYERVDLNTGCPFPLQTRHGRGAGLLTSPNAVAEIAEVVRAQTDLRFSLKMRLGMERADEWRGVIDSINQMPLVHLTVHPRVARQQYKGEINLEAFSLLAAATPHPLLYNGDLRSLADMRRIEAAFGHRLAGLMLGRGLLAQPWLALEYTTGEELPEAERRRILRALHDGLMADYERRIPDEAQRLGKLRTFWDHLEPTLGHKPWKRIHKAGSWRNYLSAVDEALG